jgi:hypothetical protein
MSRAPKSRCSRMPSTDPGVVGSPEHAARTALPTANAVHSERSVNLCKDMFLPVNNCCVAAIGAAHYHGVAIVPFGRGSLRLF